MSKGFLYFCVEILTDMTEEYKKLLSDFDTRLKQLMLLCDKLKAENESLSQALEKEKAKVSDTNDSLRVLTAKYDRLKLAGYIAATKSDVTTAKLRVNKLVREIDKCIALLNE